MNGVTPEPFEKFYRATPAYGDIPEYMAEALYNFVGRFRRDWRGADSYWDTMDLDEQVECILDVIKDLGDDLSELDYVEQFFSRSTPPNAAWEELPADAPLEDRALRVALCFNRSLDDSTTYEKEVDKHGVDALESIAKKLRAWEEYWPLDLEAQTTLVLKLLTEADSETMREFKLVEGLFHFTGNPKYKRMHHAATRRDRARRMAACMEWERQKSSAIQADKEGQQIHYGEHFATRPNTNLRRWMKSDNDNLIRAKGPEYRCPRCGHHIPDDVHVNEWEGAWSRTDHRTEICSPCGRVESWEERSGTLTPQSAWPVEHQEPPTVTGFSDAWEHVRASNRGAVAPAPMPREVPDLRLHLLEKWIPGGSFEKHLELRNTIAGSNTAEFERRTLRQASLWWVSEEMMNITLAAATKMPGDVRAEEITLPAEQSHGLVVLAKPWLGLDSMDPTQTVRVDAFTWAPSNIDGGDCLSITMYRYFDFTGGLGPADLKEAIDTGAIMDASEDLVGNGPADQRRGRLRGGAWIYQGRSDWPLRETLEGFEILAAEFPSGHPYTDNHKASLAEDRRFFASFAFLVGQKLLAETEMVWAPRAVRKRAERAGVDAKREPSHVRLIKLRQIRRKHHETDADYEKRKVEYSHRWIVSAHWAWRRCGPKGVNRRRVYIAPYPKGPEDKPLVIKDDVRVWTR
jgi:hypothetical protein